LLACDEQNEAPAPLRYCDSGAEVFSETCVHRLELALSSEAWSALSLPERPEVHARLDFDEHHFADVGLRLKGAGSYDTMEGKPAFKVDLNQWLRGTKLDGLKAFRLHNGKSWDPTLSHEYLAYALARDAGLLAPRVGFAFVTVNGIPFGLYTLVEKHDDVMLAQSDPARAAGGSILEAEGSFYDLGVGALDEQPELLLSASIEEGPMPPDPALLAALLELDRILAGTPSEDAAEQLFALVPRERFLSYLAWEAVAQHRDGYRMGANWRLFVDGETQQVEWVATGADSTWAGGLGATDAFCGMSSPEAFRSAFRFCMELGSCRKGYAERVLALAERVETLELSQRFEALTALLQPFIAADPRFPFTREELEFARTMTAEALGPQLAAMRSAVLQQYPELGR
jgi:spore coat protein CotH